jgi:hypothetical protein
MNRKIVGVGAIVLVVGVALGLLAPAFEPLPFSYDNFTIGGGRFATVNVTLSNATSVFLYDANFSSPVDVYLFTRSAYRSWSGSVSASGNGFGAAEALEGGGALEILDNVTEFVVPGSGTGKVVYAANGSAAGNYAAGNYSIVFENYNGSAANRGAVDVQMAYIPPTTLAQLGNGSRVGSYLYSVGVIEFVFFIAMPIAGIAVMVYGAFRRPKAAASSEAAEVDKLYRGVGKAKQPNKR